jgi:iron-sulfur cluster repair protein YtfE (RIC family)
MLSGLFGGRSKPPEGAGAFFTDDHRSCDALYAKVEAAVDDDSDLASAWSAFDAAMRSHFAMEEEVLFPAITEATGFAGGPLWVMRAEHDQMRDLLHAIGEHVARGEGDKTLDLGDTLLMLIQQHNTKEEAIVYPMADDAVRWSALQPKLAAYRG